MLPPVKIKVDDNRFVQGYNISSGFPIKIKIDDEKFYDVVKNLVKIKICDRDTKMSLAYEQKYARVKDKDGIIKEKLIDDILKTDEVLEYLSSDYIKPLKIKILDLDVVYAVLEDIIIKFNFAARIETGYSLVLQFGKFVAKIIHRASSDKYLTKSFGKPRFVLKFKDLVAIALDIFKVEGLKSSLKFKEKLSGFTSMTGSGKIKTIFHVPAISETIIYDIYPKTIGELLGVEEASGDKLGEFVLGASRLATGNTIEDVVTDKSIYDMLYKKVPRAE